MHAHQQSILPVSDREQKGKEECHSPLTFIKALDAMRFDEKNAFANYFLCTTLSARVVAGRKAVPLARSAENIHTFFQINFEINILLKENYSSPDKNNYGRNLE